MPSKWTINLVRMLADVYPGHEASKSQVSIMCAAIKIIFTGFFFFVKLE